MRESEFRGLRLMRTIHEICVQIRHWCDFNGKGNGSLFRGMRMTRIIHEISARIQDGAYQLKLSFSYQRRETWRYVVQGMNCLQVKRPSSAKKTLIKVFFFYAAICFLLLTY